MPRPIAGSLVICERIMREDDGVLSVIRIYDLYKLAPFDPNTPPEKRLVPVKALAMVRFAPDDEEEHTLDVGLISPGQPEASFYRLPEKIKVDPTLKIPYGMDINMSGDILPRLGTHYLIMRIDEQEFCRTAFTVLPPE